MRDLIYQIFVDRFAGDGGRALDDPPAGVNPWQHHAGGTLDGITARLDHVVALGAGALYLTPIFSADSNHKYDTRSFDQVDPHFGGDAAFARLAEACRARGLGLILDAVFNHTGEHHPWFVEKRPGFFKEGAFWRGYGHLPELDLSNRSVRDELLKVLQHGLERGATGWRLDCANDLGLEFCSEIASTNAPDGAIGEVMTYAEEWVREGRLDGVMNYYFRETALGLASGEVRAVQALENLSILAENYRYEALLRSWNVLSTHDTPRLRPMLSSQAQRELVFGLAFTAPGTPLLYYGEELGMEGAGDPDNRRPMIWDETRWDRETLAYVQQLVRLRKKYRALREGAFLPMPHPGVPDLLAYARTTEDPREVVVILANGSATPLRARAFLPYSHLFDALPLNDALGRLETARVSAGRIDVTLAPHQLAILIPDDTTIRGYTFFRR